jgi:hypothetical protein
MASQWGLFNREDSCEVDLSKKLTLNDKFKFSCYKGIECFTKCCNSLKLFLTPYDIIRIKNRLKITSEEFLREYTVYNIQSSLPVVMLKMDENGDCPFVSPDGCTIYNDRPASCRLYPLARMRSRNEEFYFIVREPHCRGFEEEKEWTVKEWIEDQGAEIYNQMNDSFLELISSRCRFLGRQFNAREIQIFYMTCYNIDKFRRFIFKTKFLDIFKIERDVIEKMKTDDVELMKFGFRWLKLALFGEKTIK